MQKNRGIKKNIIGIYIVLTVCWHYYKSFTNIISFNLSNIPIIIVFLIIIPISQVRKFRVRAVRYFEARILNSRNFRLIFLTTKLYCHSKKKNVDLVKIKGQKRGQKGGILNKNGLSQSNFLQKENKEFDYIKNEVFDLTKTMLRQ